MKRGHLSSWFTGVAWKRLTAVEALPHKSNQHEFDGVQKLKTLLGNERRWYPGTVAYLMDDDPEPLRADVRLTWYDARERVPKRSEWRLYYPTTFVSERYSEGDLLIIARRADDTLLVVVAEEGSTIEGQLMWLFGLGAIDHPGFSVKGEIESGHLMLDFATNFVLDLIGEKVDHTDDSCLDVMLRLFGRDDPPPDEFSEYVRGTVQGLVPMNDPDTALLVWMEREEVLYRTLERHRIGDRLSVGFHDVPGSFFNFSAEVQARRSLRQNRALASHFEHLLQLHGVDYGRGTVVEPEVDVPDFVFAGAAVGQLDLWRKPMARVLAVRSRTGDLASTGGVSPRSGIDSYLLTLEPGLGAAQMTALAKNRITPVVPVGLKPAFQQDSSVLVLSVGEFLKTLGTIEYPRRVSG